MILTCGCSLPSPCDCCPTRNAGLATPFATRHPRSAHAGFLRFFGWNTAAGDRGHPLFCRHERRECIHHRIGLANIFQTMRPAESRGRGGRAGSGNSCGGPVRRGPEGRAGGGGRRGAGTSSSSSSADTLPLPLQAFGPPPVFITADPPCTAAAGTSSQGARGSIVAGMPVSETSHRAYAGYLRQMFMRQHLKHFGYFTAALPHREHAQAMEGAERHALMPLNGSSVSVVCEDAHPCRRIASPTMPAPNACLLSHHLSIWWMRMFAKMRTNTTRIIPPTARGKFSPGYVVRCNRRVVKRMAATGVAHIAECSAVGRPLTRGGRGVQRAGAGLSSLPRACLVHDLSLLNN